MKTASLMLTILLALSGCNRYYYAANQHNVPLFREKNEARLSGAFTAGDYVGGFEIQGGYSITKGLAVIGNACVINSGSDQGRGHLYELGAGYYHPFRPEAPRISGKFVFEIYGVAGLGAAKDYYCYPGYAGTNFFKSYVQPSIGFTSDIVDVAGSVKIGVLHFYNVRHTFSDTCTNPSSSAIPDDVSPFEMIHELQRLESHQTLACFEPAITFRIGYQYAKFCIQFGGSFLSSSDAQYLNSNVNLNFGVVVFLAPRYWKKKRGKSD